MIYRPLYVDKIMVYTDMPFVKVLTGIRRCGKSTILKMIMDKLQNERRIPKERIVKYTFSNVGNTFSAKSISDYLKSEHRSLDNETVYSYLELCRRGYTVHIGKTPDGEVDFVAQRQGDKLYVQVTQEIQQERILFCRAALCRPYFLLCVRQSWITLAGIVQGNGF